MAHHTRYLVSAQGNQNLALDSTDLKWHANLTDADTAACKLAREKMIPSYVYAVTVEPARQHIPSVIVKSSDTL